MQQMEDIKCSLATDISERGGEPIPSSDIWRYDSSNYSQADPDKLSLGKGALNLAAICLPFNVSNLDAYPVHYSFD